MLDICLLGSGGMMPLPDRWLTSLLIRHNGKMVLIDCGEGTQIPLKLSGWGFKAIDAVLFTHYHADHVAGLPGFLLTLGNSGREEPLTLAGPPGLTKVVEGLTVISPQLPYDLIITELSDSEYSEIMISDMLVKSLPVDHTLPCLSYGIELKRQGKFDVERANKLDIPVSFWKQLQKGEKIILKDRVITPDMVLGKPRKGLKVSYCTDTRPTEKLVEFIKDSDLFICEGMYGEDEDSSKAEQKKHMTFSEAGSLARQGNVGELWLTHFSPSMADPEKHIEVARNIFSNTVAGKELLTRTIRYEN